MVLNGQLFSSRASRLLSCSRQEQQQQSWRRPPAAPHTSQPRPAWGLTELPPPAPRWAPPASPPFQLQRRGEVASTTAGGWVVCWGWGKGRERVSCTRKIGLSGMWSVSLQTNHPPPAPLLSPPPHGSVLLHAHQKPFFPETRRLPALPFLPISSRFPPPPPPRTFLILLKVEVREGSSLATGKRCFVIGTSRLVGTCTRYATRDGSAAAHAVTDLCTSSKWVCFVELMGRQPTGINEREKYGSLSEDAVSWAACQSVRVPCE